MVKSGCKINNGHQFKKASTMCYPVFKRDWTTCSKYDFKHCRLSSQHHNGGALYNHLMSTRILTLMMNKIFIRAPKTMKNMATERCVFANHLVLIVFRILREVGAERIVSD